MKNTLAPQLAAAETNEATSFIACNNSGNACHLHINLTSGTQESRSLCISELNSPKRSSELFVKPGKAIRRQALPPCVSTQKTLVCLLPAGCCWSDLCLSSQTVVVIRAVASLSKQTVSNQTVRLDKDLLNKLAILHVKLRVFFCSTWFL